MVALAAESDDKRSSRLNAINHLLSTVPYERRDPDEVVIPPRPLAESYDRPPRDDHQFVPDHAATLSRKKRKRGKKNRKAEPEVPAGVG